MIKISTLKFNVSTYSLSSEKSVSKLQVKDNSGNSGVSDICIKRIIDFARSYRVTETEATGKIEMVLN